MCLCPFPALPYSNQAIGYLSTGIPLFGDRSSFPFPASVGQSAWKHFFLLPFASYQYKSFPQTSPFSLESASARTKMASVRSFSFRTPPLCLSHNFAVCAIDAIFPRGENRFFAACTRVTNFDCARHYNFAPTRHILLYRETFMRKVD